MTPQQDYANRLRSLVARLEVVLSAEERADMERLIDHGEGPEAMLTLAWVRRR